MLDNRRFPCVLLLILVLLAGQTVFVPQVDAADAPLPDLEGHWAEAELRSLYYRGIIDGFPDGLFYPERSITRAQLAKLIVEAVGLGKDAAGLLGSRSRFSDVPAGHWALGYIEVAAELGVVNGYPGGTFGPERAIERDELVTMVVRALGLKTSPVSSPDALPYSDRATISGWALPNIVSAYEAGLLEDYAGATFRPDETATRAEAGILVRHFLEARGSLYDFTGFLLSRNARVLTVKVAGQELRLTVRSDAELFTSGTRTDLTALEPLQELAMVLDDSGRVLFAEVFEEDVMGTVLDVNPSDSLLEIDALGVRKTLAVGQHATVFRNGRTAALGSLQEGDSVFVVSSVFTGEAAYVDATRFDIEGEVVEVDATGSSILVLDDAGKTVAVEVPPEALVLLDGRVAAIDQLQAGLELHVSTGGSVPPVASYIEAYEEEGQP